MRIEILEGDVLVSDDSGTVPAVLVSFSEDTGDGGPWITLIQGEDNVTIAAEILGEVIEVMKSF